MEQPEPANIKPEHGWSQPTSHWNAVRPEVVWGLLTLREAKERFGLGHRVIYAAVKQGFVHAVQRNGQGRTYYPEWELRALRERAIRELYRGNLAA